MLNVYNTYDNEKTIKTPRITFSTLGNNIINKQILLDNSYIRELNIKGCMLVGDSILSSVMTCKTLVRLSIGGNKISSANFQNFLVDIKSIRPEITIGTTPSLLSKRSSSLAKRVADHPPK